jgi:hypothetical protein
VRFSQENWSVTGARHGRLTFDISADGQWQEVVVALPTDKRLQQLRLDVCENEGKATIADVKLIAPYVPQPRGKTP